MMSLNWSGWVHTANYLKDKDLTHTNETQQFTQQTKALIDDLKSVCAHYGLGNDGNEFKIITQVFRYKFLNDKFVHEIKQLDETIAKAENWKGSKGARGQV